MNRILTLILSIIISCSINLAYSEDTIDDFALNDNLLKLQQNFIQNQNAISPFSINTEVQDNSIIFNFTLQDGSYIYKDYFKITSNSKIKYAIKSLPIGVLHEDLQGQNYILDNDFSITIDILEAKLGDIININYQGCSADGICYPPMSYSYTLTQDYNYTATDTIAQNSTQKNFSLQSLLNSNFTLALLAAVAFGMLLNLTPCVIPMLPIFSAMITGNTNASLKKIIFINIAYALGLSLSYMILGILLSLLGAQLQAVLQHAVTLYIMAAIVFIFALSSAGLFEVQLPTTLLSKLQNTILSFNRGSLFSAFGFGVISSILATPCTSAPLAGVVIYVLQDGNLIKGALTFLCLGLGMALPLFCIGVFGSNLFAKLKAKSMVIKKILSAMLFALAIYLIRNHLGAYSNIILQCSIIAIALYLAFSIMQIFNKYKTIINMAIACVIAITINLIYVQIWQDSKIVTPFTKIQKLEQIDNTIAGQKIYLSFSASWCTNCIALKKTVYSQDKFKELAQEQDLKLYEIELNDFNDENTKKLIQRYQIIGVPSFVILDQNLNTLTNGVGYLSFEEIAKIIKSS